MYKKLKYYAIQGKPLKVLRSTYSRIRTCVKSSGCMSQSFENNVGLLQGEVLSQMKIVFKTVSFKQSKINPKSIIGQNRKKKYLSIRHDKSTM